MRGRGPGLGTIRKKKTASGRTVYEGHWTDARGVRHHRILAESRREAERVLAKVIRARDLEAHGLGREEDQERFIDEIAQLYIDDLAGHRRPKYVNSVTYNLEFLLAWLGPTRVRDLTVERIPRRDALGRGRNAALGRHRREGGDVHDPTISREGEAVASGADPPATA